MIASAATLLIPLALTAGLNTASPAPSLHHDERAFVTGYNTVPGQTDSTPCIAASGADICGRRDAVACPRRISLGTTIEISGSTYVCEDRLAKKYDSRIDISCDKDTACPYQVTGWADIKVFDVGRPQPVVATAKPSDTVAPLHVAAPIRLAASTGPQHAAANATRIFAALHPRLAAVAARVFPTPRSQLTAAAAKFIERTTTHLASAARPVSVLRGRT